MVPVIVFVLLMLPCILSSRRIVTSYGGICTSPCDKHGYSYYWCYQAGYADSSWDYCSPEEGYDYVSRSCVSACDNYNYPYTWCRVEGGNWGYCGHINEQVENHFTRYGVQCVTDCKKENGYFQCIDSNNKREYCSPSSDVTRKGEPCRNNHHCDSYEKSYTWCYTDEHDHWEYCGKISKECLMCGHLSHRKKRQDEEELCRIEDTGNRRVTKLITVPETRLGSLTRSQFTDASHVINKVTAQTVFVRGTMFTFNTVRLDVQGDFVRDGVRYINLQVQLNGPRQGQSSVSQALIPADLEVPCYFRYIRRALQTSLRGAYHGDPVKVFVIIQSM